MAPCNNFSDILVDFGYLVVFLQCLAKMDAIELAGNDFYKNLMKMKEAHQKELQKVELLYKAKQAQLSERQSPTIPNAPLTSLENFFGSSAAAIQKKTVVEGGNDVQSTIRAPAASQTTRAIRDGIKDLSAAKPPSGKPKQSEGLPSRSAQRSWQHESLDRAASSDGESGSGYWKVPDDIDLTDNEMSEGEKNRYILACNHTKT